MNRYVVMLASAGAIILGLSNPILAQAPQNLDPNSSATTAAPPPANATAPTARERMMKPEKKAQRMAARADCRAQGKQQSLTHGALRNYVKSCLAAH
jgi:hypothetical protein